MPLGKIVKLDNFTWVRQKFVALSLILCEYICTFVFASNYEELLIIQDSTIWLLGKSAFHRFKNLQSVYYIIWDSETLLCNMINKKSRTNLLLPFLINIPFHRSWILKWRIQLEKIAKNSYSKQKISNIGDDWIC